MAGYIRQDTSNNIADGNIINASDFDNEYNAIEAAFSASTGHTHDGTAAEGAPITKIGPTQDVVASASALTPKTDNTVDLGSSTLEYKDLWIDGTANIDSLVADTADINAGTIDGVTIGGSTRGAGSFTTLDANGNVTLGDASTDTVQVNGYMGVGGAGNSNIGIRLQNTLTGGTTATGLYSNPTADSGTTSSITGVGAIPKTAAASFTVSNVYGFFAFDTSKGAGSTITNQHGLYIADQTQGTNNFGITSLVSSGSNKWNIYASGTAQNYFAGNVGIGTSSPDTLLHLAGNDTAVIRLENTDTTLTTDQVIGALEFEKQDASGGGVGVVGGMRMLSADSSGTNSKLLFNVARTATNNVNVFTLDVDGAVFNDIGEDYDFRVESDTNTHALFVDAGNSRVGINNSSPTNALSVTGAMDVSGNVTLGDATTDTVTVNGYMGVGGIANSVVSAYIRGTHSGSATDLYAARVTQTIPATTTGFWSAFANVNSTTAASAFTAQGVHSFYASNIAAGAGSTITNQYGLNIEDLTSATNNYGIRSLVSSGTDKWNIYASGTANNAFAGNVRIGSTTAPTNALSVTGAMDVSGNVTLGDASTDTVRVNGYMGVGGAAAGTHVKSTITGTTTGSTTQIGCYVNTTFDNSATSQASGIRSTLSTVDASFIASQLAHFRAGAITKGAASTITNLYGLYIEDQTQGTNNFGITSLVSSGTNKWNIYASGTAANYFAGNVGIGTSSPGSVLDVRASGGSLPATNSVDIAYFSKAGSGGIQIISGTTGAAFVGFGDTDSRSRGVISYDNSVDALLFASAGTERMRIDASGNLGLGVTPSAWVSGSVSQTISNAVVARRNNGASVFGHNFYESAANTFTYTQTGVATRIEAPTAGGLTFNTAPSGTAGTAITFTERANIGLTEMVVNDPGNDYDFRVESDTNTHALFVQGSDGNVGIGTTAPTNNLEITGAASTAATLRVNGGSGANTNAVLDLTGRGSGNQFNNTEIRSLGQAANGGILTLSTDDSSGTLQERLRITSDGYVRLTSGSLGIQFNGDTAAANALDDYEEGTFTPTIVGTSTAGTGTYTTQVGRYTKIGNRVYFTAYIVWTAHTGTGNMRASALPFTSNSTANNFNAVSVWNANIALTASNLLTAYVEVNSTSVTLTQYPVGGGASAAVPIDTAASLIVSGHYEV
jgi:hypothetical protein